MEPVRVWMLKPHATSEPKKLRGSVAPKKESPPVLQKKTHLPHDDDDGWTLVTRRKARKQIPPQLPPVYRRKKQTTKKRPRQAKGKKKPKKTVKSKVLPTDLLEQIPPVPITLGDFFPEDFLNNATVNATSGAIIDDSEEKPKEKARVMEEKPEHQDDAEIIDILETLPKDEQWEQIFHLPEETRAQIAQALLKPKSKEDATEDTKESVESHPRCTSCNTALTFSDEDLLLGSKPHNRPLYVTGYIRGRKVKRILVDGGSGVNLMPKATMEELGIAIGELSNSHMVIHGFNLNTERAIGMIRVNLGIGDLVTSTLFHVIDVKTSFKLLLGRPWKHENGVVASTLHQCLKYYYNGERKINGDVKPFTESESFFADAKFFKEGGVSSELLPSIIPSTGKSHKKEGDNTNQNVSEKKSETGLKAKDKIRVATPIQKPRPTPGKELPILRYIPQSRRKAGESPFQHYQKPEMTSSSKNGWQK